MDCPGCGTRSMARPSATLAVCSKCGTHVQVDALTRMREACRARRAKSGPYIPPDPAVTMMSGYKKVIYELQVGVWTPVYAPIACNIFWVQNQDGQAMRECTDVNPGADSAYDILAAGVLQYLPPYSPPHGSLDDVMSWTRFRVNDLVTNLQADSEDSTATVTFIL